MQRPERGDAFDCETWEWITITNKSCWATYRTIQCNSVFWIHHDGHCKPHLAIVLEGQALPPCSRCGNKVRYVPANESPQRWGLDYLTEELDFLRTGS
jgi:hypothetical protein